MAKIAVFTVIALLVFLVAVVNAAGDCPLPSKVLTCSPKCVDDTECSSLGRKCCKNICNSKSCLMPNQGGSSSSSGGYKGSSATGSYCGNVKCNSYEKCELDRTSKRMKCVRA